MKKKSTKIPGKLVCLVDCCLFFLVIVSHTSAAMSFSRLFSFSHLRTRVQASDALQKMIWPWIEAELEKVWALQNDPRAPANSGVTAAAFLVLLKHLRLIVLQDAAAMVLEAPERAGHIFFTASVFQSREFDVFKLKVKEELEKQDEVERATVDECMPYVMRRFDINEAHQNDILAGVREIAARQGQVEMVVKGVANSFRNAANVLANSNFESVEAVVRLDSTSATGTTGDMNTMGEGNLSRAARYKLLGCFHSVQEMHSCWFGRGRFEEMPMRGGIDACEKKWKNGQWRKGWSNSEVARFSRIKRIVVSCEGKEERIRLLDSIYFKKQSLASCVQFGQEQGWITSRKRKSTTIASPEV